MIVDRLVERALVERRPDPGDGRVKLIAATDAGRELANRCCQDREWLGPALDGLTADELEAVRAGLTLLTRG